MMTIAKAKSITFINSIFSAFSSHIRDVFEISETEFVLIENCIFSNITITDGSLFSLHSSFLEIKGSSFSNNRLNQIKSGTTPNLFFCSSPLIITQTQFFNNFLMNSTLIYVINSKLSTNSLDITFSNNVIFDSNVGLFESPLCIFISGENISVFMKENVIFTNNQATKSLISILKTKSQLFASDTLFKNNSGNELTQLNSIKTISFKNFQCVRSNQFLNPNFLPGNCLSVIDYQSVFLKNCTFSNNFAISTITGILLQHTNEDSIVSPSAIFEKLECFNNIVNATESIIQYPGNCLLLKDSGLTTIINANFTNNVINVDLFAKFIGNPCLHSTGAHNTLIIFDSIFKGNKAYTECSCINFHGDEFIMKNSSFIENRALKVRIGESLPSYSIFNEGGSLNLGAENINMQDVLIFNGSAMKGAGIFLHNKNSKPFQKISCSNLTFLNNEGTQTSGIEFDATLYLGISSFLNCHFLGNTVEFYGVISTFYYTIFNIYFSSCEISHNWGVSAGAVFSFCHFDGVVVINDTIFYKNVLNQSVFIGGAAIFVYGFTKSTLIFVRNSSFIENSCELKGGAIQATYGQVFVEDSIFNDNFAVIGGAISMSVYCPGNLTNVLIKNFISGVNQGGGAHCSDFSLLK